MRIIGGKNRSRKIKQPNLDKVRPTKDRVREAIFNMIAGEVSGAKVLDLFSGTGAYGLEALSRGAKSCTFVESDRDVVHILEENIKSLGEGDNSTVLIDDGCKAVEDLSKNKARFDIIFADPPYTSNLSKNILIIINQYDILEHFGVLVIEHNKAEELPEKEENITTCKQKTYGHTSVSIFLRK